MPEPTIIIVLEAESDTLSVLETKTTFWYNFLILEAEVNIFLFLNFEHKILLVLEAGADISDQNQILKTGDNISAILLSVF